MIDTPKIGQIWERDKLQREIIDIVKRSNRKNDYNIIWARPMCHKKFTIWLPYWKTWRNKAHLVNEG